MSPVQGRKAPRAFSFKSPNKDSKEGSFVNAYVWELEVLAFFFLTDPENIIRLTNNLLGTLFALIKMFSHLWKSYFFKEKEDNEVFNLIFANNMVTPYNNSLTIDWKTGTDREYDTITKAITRGYWRPVGNRKRSNCRSTHYRKHLG